MCRDVDGVSRTVNNVTYADTVQDIRRKLELKCGQANAALSFVFGGKELLAHRPLYQYGVGPGSTIHLVVRGPGGAPQQQQASPCASC